MEYRSDDGVTVRIRFVDLFDVQKDIEKLRAVFYWNRKERILL